MHVFLKGPESVSDLQLSSEIVKSMQTLNIVAY